MVSFSKEQTRSKIKTLCESLDIKSRSMAACKVLDYLKPLLDKANSIAIYHAHGFELNLFSVIDYSLKNNKKLFVPVSYRHRQEMLLTKYNATQTDIFMPDLFVPPDPIWKWYNLDLVLLPLVAVNHNGVRLGKGGGYYDVTLADVVKREQRPILCGVGYDCQLLNDMSVDSWDIRLDYFASEKELKKF